MFKGILIILSIILLNYSFNKERRPIINVDQQVAALTYNEKLIKTFNGGYNRLISSSTWVQTLLDSDYSHYKGNDLNNWLYKRFNFITEIDPHFKIVYIYGGEFLSVMKDDILASNKILEKGLAIYPNDFWINYFLGHNAYSELRDYEKALIYFKKIESLKEKPYLPVPIEDVISSLYRKKGDYNISFSLICDRFHKVEDKKLKNKYLLRLKSLLTNCSDCDLKKCLGNK